MSLKKAIIGTLIILILMAGAFALRFSGFFEKGLAIEAAEVDVGMVEEITEMSGNIDSESTQSVVSNAEGFVADLKVEEGVRVRKGEALCRIRNPELRGKLLGMKAELEAARENIERPVAGADPAMARARVGFMQANIADLEESMRPRSHIEGDVIKVNVQNGEGITRGTVLFFIADMDGAVVKARMNEEDVQKVRAGQPVWISGEFLSGRKLQGKVSGISRFVERQIATYVETTCMIFNPKGIPIIFGADVDIKVITARKRNVLRVPRRSIIMGGSGERPVCHVFKIEDGRALKIPVKLGIIGEDYAEVVEGLAQGDTVATAQSLELEDGQKVIMAH